MKEKIELPVIGNEIFRTSLCKNIIYEVIYKDVKCYAIVHKKSGHIEIFDHDAKLLDNIIKKIKRCGALTHDKKANSALLKFHPNDRERSISLRLYVYAKYHNLDLDQVRGHKIMLVDYSLTPYNISDLRKGNLYDAGGSRPNKKNGNTTIISDPNNPEHKAILVTATENEKSDLPEIYEYSEELYEMITSSRYCSITRCPDTGRLSATVHYARGKDGYKILTLSRFALLYYTHFDEYRNRRGAIKRFISAIPRLDEKHADEEAAHILPNKWNGNRANLMFMKDGTNPSMSDYMAHFSGEYKAFATLAYDGEILVELLSHEQPVLYICSTAERYCNFQKVMLGKSKLTENFNLIHFRKDGTVEKINTPKEEYEAANKKIGTPDNLVHAYWEWCHRMDELCSHYVAHPEDFRKWGTTENKIKLTDDDGNISGEINSFLLNILSLYKPAFEAE